MLDFGFFGSMRGEGQGIGEVAFAIPARNLVFNCMSRSMFARPGNGKGKHVRDLPCHSREHVSGAENTSRFPR